MNFSTINACHYGEACWDPMVALANRAILTDSIPIVVFMLILMLTGIPGNLLVIIVYRKTKKRTTAILFIECLAYVDLITVCCVHPYVIFKLCHSSNQTWEMMCKLFEFGIHASLCVSAIILLMVSIDRFVAICFPLKYLHYQTFFRSIMVGSCIASVIFSSPIIMFYGKREVSVKMKDFHVKAYICDISDRYQNSSSIAVFSTFAFVMYIIVCSCLVVFYTCVARTAYRSRRVNPLVSLNTKADKHLEEAYQSSSVNLSGTYQERRVNHSKAKLGRRVNSLEAYLTRRVNRSETYQPRGANTSEAYQESVSTFRPLHDNRETIDVSLASTQLIEQETTFVENSIQANKNSNTKMRTRSNTFLFSKGAHQKSDFCANVEPELKVSNIFVDEFANLPTNSNRTKQGQDIIEAREIQTQKLKGTHDLRKARKSLPQKLKTAQDLLEARKILPQKLKAAKILSLVTLVFILSWLPFWIVRFASISTVDEQHISFYQNIVINFLSHLFYLNNAINPLIYAIVHKNFRHECREMISRKKQIPSRPLQVLNHAVK